MPDPIGDQVISREAADTVTSVLTGVVDDGTAQASVAEQPRARRPAGRGQDGYVRRQQVGLVHRLHARPGHLGRPVRRGRQDPRKQVPMYKAGGEPRVNGGGFPAQIWAAYTFGVMGDGRQVRPGHPAGRGRPADAGRRRRPRTPHRGADAGADDRGAVVRRPRRRRSRRSSPPPTPSTSPPTLTPPTSTGGRHRRTDPATRSTRSGRAKQSAETREGRPAQCRAPLVA